MAKGGWHTIILSYRAKPLATLKEGRLESRTAVVVQGDANAATALPNVSGKKVYSVKATPAGR